MDKRDTLSMAVRSLESEVAERTRAMETLRSNCPPHVLGLRDAMVGVLKSSTLNRKRGEVRSKVRSLEGLRQLVPFDAAHAATVASIIGSMPSAERPDGILNGPRGQVHRSIWESFVNSKPAELPTLKAELATMEIELEKRPQAIKERLDYYTA
jgi:hypothetical protein